MVVAVSAVVPIVAIPVIATWRIIVPVMVLTPPKEEGRQKGRRGREKGKLHGRLVTVPPG